MGAMASLITSLTRVYSTVHSCADQRKHQSSASLAFVRGIHRRPVISPHKWLVTRKMFPCHDRKEIHCFICRSQPTELFRLTWQDKMNRFIAQVNIISLLSSKYCGSVTANCPPDRLLHLVRAFFTTFDIKCQIRQVLHTSTLIHVE